MEAIIESSRVFYFDWELNLLHWFQSIHNDFLDFIVPQITFLGNAGWFWIVITILLIVLPLNRKLGFQAAISIILTVLVCNVILKPMVMRCRPCWLEQDVQMLVKVPHDFSFPSGHSNISFAVATAIFTRNKKFGIPAIILAGCIAISRLYVFVHWPTDVIVGTLIGVSGGIVSYFIINALYTKFGRKVDI
ncbi:undecaprenyl-diphosphatase [Pseudobutyrivibrio sp. YE44]|uniref:phosphatase PAP2 family protein n=1 Tax=Pseudobutyrivibrio sp. YE44 TaxID=1520802 RepID=UPI00088300EA|nr:phosphatase PAP2 family protein [Pseudobutyrivibrio sp. YE44]SDB52697.1 undecaprenyl-diphosphatase [Pseudobutyrivibrio sp. YE44]